MRVVHVFSKNLEIFEKALEGTGCVVNGSADLDYFQKSLYSFNAREVMGLVVFANPLTKRILKLLREFNDLFTFSPRPIILISDDASRLWESGKLKRIKAPLFMLDSLDNTISDRDLNRICVTLCCLSGFPYDLSLLEESVKGESATGIESSNGIEEADQVLSELIRLSNI